MINDAVNHRICLRDKCGSPSRLLASTDGTPQGIRTLALRIKSPLLYTAELEGHVRPPTSVMMCVSPYLPPLLTRDTGIWL